MNRLEGGRVLPLSYDRTRSDSGRKRRMELDGVALQLYIMV